MEPPKDLNNATPEYREYIQLLAERLAEDPLNRDEVKAAKREERLRELYKILGPMQD